MFHKAERKQAKLRLALCGPSGSGKTYSALKIAEGLGGKVAMVDTEFKSGELYANDFNYDVATLEPPFTPQRYIELFHMAEENGFNVLIIDSLSHAWTGQGGVLEMHDHVSKSVRNSFAAWREVTPHHNALVDAILQSKMHIITTMRTKTAYEIQQTDKGKTQVIKVGLAPVQREGMEYEFTTVMDLSVEGHIASTSKDRTGLFDGQFFKPTVNTGKKLKKWLDTGVDSVKQSESERILLLETLSLVQSKEELEAWADENKAGIELLLPADRQQIRKSYAQVRDQFKQSGLDSNALDHAA